MRDKNIVLRIDPNKGARFGHQFYEVALIRAWSIFIQAKCIYNQGFSANSKLFGAIFVPADSIATAVSSVDKFIFLSDFSCANDFAIFFDDFISNKKNNNSIEIIGDLQSSPWFSNYIRSSIDSQCIDDGLLYLASHLRFSIFKLGLVKREYFRRVAVHIRRGDIVTVPRFSSRLVDIEYYIDVIDKLVNFSGCKYENIDLYSTPDLDVTPFRGRRNVTLRTDIDEVSAFCEMSSHAAIVGSPSGFSFAAHLTSLGAVLVHENDWNRYSSTYAFRDADRFCEFCKILKLSQ